MLAVGFELSASAVPTSALELTECHVLLPCSSVTCIAFSFLIYIAVWGLSKLPMGYVLLVPCLRRRLEVHELKSPGIIAEKIRKTITVKHPLKIQREHDPVETISPAGMCMPSLILNTCRCSSYQWQQSPGPDGVRCR